jgi:hypothetical protein
VIAICTTTSVARSFVPPPPTRSDALFSTVPGSLRNTRRAGALPLAMATKTASNTLTANTGASRRTPDSSRIDPCACAPNVHMTIHATHNPSSHPSVAMTTFSAAQALTTWPVPPPSARRTAYSRCRAEARPTISPETLAHAISRTSTAPAANGSTAARPFSRNTASSRRTVASRRWPGARPPSISFATRRTSSCACWSVAPDASRATSWKRRWSFELKSGTSGTSCAGTHRSVLSVGNANSRGMTAAIRKLPVPTVTAAPIAAVSRASCSMRRRLSAIVDRPRAISATEPRADGMPSVSKNPSVTIVARTLRGSLPARSEKSLVAYAARPFTARSRRCQSSNSARPMLASRFPAPGYVNWMATSSEGRA